MPFSKDHTWVQQIFVNYNLPLLGKVVERAAAFQWQKALSEADYLNTFLCGFRLGYIMQAALWMFSRGLETKVVLLS